MCNSIDEREDWEDLVRQFLSGDVGTPVPPATPQAPVARGGRHVRPEPSTTRFCVA